MLEDHVGTIDARRRCSPSAASRSDYHGLLAAQSSGAFTTIFANAASGAYKGDLEFLTFANTSIATGGITNGATVTYVTDRPAAPSLPNVLERRRIR